VLPSFDRRRVRTRTVAPGQYWPLGVNQMLQLVQQVNRPASLKQDNLFMLGQVEPLNGGRP